VIIKKKRIFIMNKTKLIAACVIVAGIITQLTVHGMQYRGGRATKAVQRQAAANVAAPTREQQIAQLLQQIALKQAELTALQQQLDTLQQAGN
jgi:hypothetical protein